MESKVRSDIFSWHVHCTVLKIAGHTEQLLRQFGTVVWHPKNVAFHNTLVKRQNFILMPRSKLSSLFSLSQKLLYSKIRHHIVALSHQNCRVPSSDIECVVGLCVFCRCDPDVVITNIFKGSSPQDNNNNILIFNFKGFF